MKNNIISFFISAAQTIFGEIGLGETLILENIEKRDSFEVIINIGISGDMKANLMIKTNFQSAFNIVNSMLNSINISPKEKVFGNLHKATIGEIANQISARAVMLLSKENIDCNITPPTIITGKTVKMEMFNVKNLFDTGIQGKFGDIFLLIGIKNLKKII